MAKRMMAAVLHKIGEQLRVETLRVPKLKAEEVTVRIRAAGICHSDLNARARIPDSKDGSFGIAQLFKTPSISNLRS